MLFLGVDTGGTFTDFVLFDGECVRVHKVLSTPASPERAILQGIRELGLEGRLDELHLVHGSTVATNAVLEGKGVRTLFITNRGFADLLTLGRQARDELYNLHPPAPTPPVPPELTLEIGGRVGADGSVVEPISERDLDDLRQRVAQLAPAAVAISLLFSYRDDGHERAVESAIPEGIFISRSSELIPEIGEYERGIATWLNSWVGPLMERYLARLSEACAGARLSVMQSSGSTIEAQQAGRRSVNLLLSGPAGGVAGARHVAQRGGRFRLLTFDMGGTSTDVALIDGEPALTTEGRIGRFPVAVPMVDIHTIGAGGGSIARVDAGGALLVGPESAGADPGPACYGRGGAAATVSDANLVLGRLLPDEFLGGTMLLDVAAAREAVGRVAASLGTTIERAALGIVKVADEQMARALRVMSVQRGVDPRELTLVSFGGAGGLHVCALAEALQMRNAMVPVHAGVLSAFGMLAAAPGRQLSRTWRAELSEVDEEVVAEAFSSLVEQGRSSLQRERVAVERVDLQCDLRYQGQSYALTLPWSGPRPTEEAFHDAHHRRFGHSLSIPVELVNLRVTVRGKALELPSQSTKKVEAPPASRRNASLYGCEAPVPLLRRASISAGEWMEGPALVIDPVATVFVAMGWRGAIDTAGNLILERWGV